MITCPLTLRSIWISSFPSTTVASSAKTLLHYDGTTYQVVTKRNPVCLAKREVLVTVNAEGLVSAWLDGVRLELKPVDQSAKPAPVLT